MSKTNDKSLASENKSEGLITVRVQQNKKFNLNLEICNSNKVEEKRQLTNIEFLEEDADVTLSDEYNFTKPKEQRNDNVSKQLLNENGMLRKMQLFKHGSSLLCSLVK